MEEVAEVHICTHPETGPSITKLEIAFGDVDYTKSYILRNATGLDPEEVMAKYYGRASGTLTKYYKPTMRERIVTLLINLNPQYDLGESVSSLRDKVYQVLSYGLTAELQLKFVNVGGTEVASLFGFIEKIEAPIFSKEPQVQITFKCTDPFFKKTDYVVVPGTMFGTEHNWNDDISNAPHGYELKFVFSSGGTPFSITNETEFGDALFYIGFSFFAGDTLYLNSEDGNKYVYVDRPLAGILQLANYIDNYSIWPIMYPGPNRLTFSAPAATTSQIKHRPTFWGL